MKENKAEIIKKSSQKKTYKQSFSNEVVDEETGEVLRQEVTFEKVDGYRDVKLPNRARLNNGNFIVLFQSVLQTIAMNRKYFSKDELVLLFYFLGTAGMGNSIYIDYPLLVKNTGIQRTNLSSAIRKLTNKNIIIKCSEIKDYGQAKIMELAVNFDQLNYNLAYNGKFKEHSKVKGHHPEINLEANNLLDNKQTTLFDAIDEE